MNQTERKKRLARRSLLIGGNGKSEIHRIEREGSTGDYQGWGGRGMGRCWAMGTVTVNRRRSSKID